MVGCCVIGCKSRGDAHFVSFFRIPQTTSNPQWTQLSIDRRTLWLERIGRSGDTISDNLRVCSRHFVSGMHRTERISLIVDWPVFTSSCNIARYDLFASG